MDFYEKLEKEISKSDDNLSITENGARGYRSTGRALLDLNFSVPNLRNALESRIFEKFKAAFDEDADLALKWLFYVRDVREGIGERRLFRSIITNIAKTNPSEICHLIKYIPFYGRWDDLLCLLSIPDVNEIALNIIEKQYVSDLDSLYNDECNNISLLGKWMPSINTSSRRTRKYAKIIIKHLGISEKYYRRSLSLLRDAINVVEKKMSSNEWDKINYSAVPSRANMIYSNAFLKHDMERRSKYIDDVLSGKEKINSGTLYPYEIVARLTTIMMNMLLLIGEYPLDEVKSLMAMWNNLPNLVDPDQKTIVVSDSSGSMYNSYYPSEVRPIDVAVSFAIYFAERLSGEFHDKFISFGEDPQIIDLSGCNDLTEKISHVMEYDSIENTDIEKVFNLILDTIVNNKMKQEDIPNNVLIISDMEFDNYRNYYLNKGNTMNKSLFDNIKDDFEKAGYKIPRLIFWNVGSRTNTIPIIENDMGIALVSGFSVNAANMIMSSKLDPYECLVEELRVERYDKIVSIKTKVENIKKDMMEKR